MAALAPGEYAWVCYEGPEHHMRLIGAWVDAGEYVVVSPDYDFFIEQLDAANADLSGLRFGEANGAPPVGLQGQPLYTFRALPVGADLARMRRALLQPRCLGTG